MPEPTPRLNAWPVGAPLAHRRGIPKADLSLREEALTMAPMFADVPKRHLRAIARVTSVRTFQAGATLMKEGSTGSSFLVIVAGEAKVLRKSRTIARGRPGDFFGEISLLDPGPRTASVVATTPLTCLDLAGQDFRRILASEPALALHLLKGLAHRFREARSGSG
jgi:CRP-like cAMP-binding protein